MRHKCGGRSLIWIGRGQCIEQYGAGEAYLPLLEALRRLCRQADGKRLIELLHEHAPSWLMQLPALVSPTEFEVLQRRVSGTTRARMLRELAEVVEVLTAERPLLLVLEDLHWSDGSTLEWLAYVARRLDWARLLVLATYRPVDAIVRAHPVRPVMQELQRHGQCVELVLPCLPETEVAAYLARRFGEGALPDELARVLRQRTDGNPLFLVMVVDELVREGIVREGAAGWEVARGLETAVQGVPESLRNMVEQQLEQLSSTDQALLEAASVAGAEFSAAAIVDSVEDVEEAIEARCNALARRGQFLRALGVTNWPDGTVTARYAFMHALFQEILYERVPVSRRVRWHRQIGARLEVGYGPEAREPAAKLAEHFAQGRDYRRAVQYLRQAGENAMQRHAYAEAIAHFSTGLALLKTLPNTLERRQQELSLQVSLSVPFILTKGYTAPEVEATCTRVRELCQGFRDTTHLFFPVYGLYHFYLVSGKLRIARVLAEQLVSLAQHASDGAMPLTASSAAATVAFFRGEFNTAHGLIEHSITHYDPDGHGTVIVQYGDDPRVIWPSFGGLILWMQGYPDQALKRSQETLAVAKQLAHPFSQVFALTFAAVFHQLRREARLTQEHAEASMRVSTEQGFPFWLAMGMVMRGWALAAQDRLAEGLEQIGQGLEALRTSGAYLWWSYCLGLWAEAQGNGGRSEEGLVMLEETLALAGTEGEEPWYGAELYRLRGELLLTSTGQGPQTTVQQGRGSSLGSCDLEAAVCFHKAIEIARQQHAKALELRVAMSLSRLWQRQGMRDEAQQLLAPIYDWFTEGFDTPDLQEAQALLGVLS